MHTYVNTHKNAISSGCIKKALESLECSHADSSGWREEGHACARAPEEAREPFGFGCLYEDVEEAAIALNLEPELGKVERRRKPRRCARGETRSKERFNEGIVGCFDAFVKGKIESGVDAKGKDSRAVAAV